MLRMTLAFVLLTGCSSEPATEVVREITTGMRTKARVEVSVKATAEEPTPEDLAARKRLEDRIEQENIGRLVSSTGGAGYYGVTIEVENTAEAIPKIQAILREMDLDRDANFKVTESS